MIRKPVVFFCLLAAGAIFFLVPGAVAVLPGGGVSIVFSCNVDGASVSVNGDSVGSISGGELEIPYEESYDSYTVSADGYYSKSGSIPAPLLGATEIPISVTLTERPPGSGKGWITVMCNVDGASVAFNGVKKGTTSSGSFTLEVATTGTPYTTYRVSKTGYTTYDGTVSPWPSDGQTTYLYATLNPVPTTTATTATTSATPIGGDIGWYAVHCNVDGASVYFDGNYKGQISGGVLSVQVYTTGTPYSTYSVEKSGYVTGSGSLPSAPAKGQTRSVYVTLNPVPTATPVIAGADKGYFTVHCNVDGASVFLDDTYEGVITNGVLTVPVYTTGTPYTTFRVAKPGYSTFNGVISQYPAKGETVDLYAVINPAATAAPTVIHTTVPATPATTYAPVPLPAIIAGLVAAICLFHACRP